jgi:protein SCO1/2
MRGKAVFPALLMLLSLVSAAATAAADDGALIAGVFSPPRLAPEFSLQGSDGTTLKLSRYRGKVVLLSFGYTSCTEVCPVTLSVLALAHRKLSTLADELQVVYITVDPERDNAEHMRKYLTAFDPSFVGGTGTSEQLAAVRRDYGISVGRKVAVPGGYVLSHSSFIYLIDPRGALRALMPFGHGAEDFVHDVRLLLKK